MTDRLAQAAEEAAPAAPRGGAERAARSPEDEAVHCHPASRAARAFCRVPGLKQADRRGFKSLTKWAGHAVRDAVHAHLQRGAPLELPPPPDAALDAGPEAAWECWAAVTGAPSVEAAKMTVCPNVGPRDHPLYVPTPRTPAVERADEAVRAARAAGGEALRAAEAEARRARAAARREMLAYYDMRAKEGEARMSDWIFGRQQVAGAAGQPSGGEAAPQP